MELFDDVILRSLLFVENEYKAPVLYNFFPFFPISYKRFLEYIFIILLSSYYNMAIIKITTAAYNPTTIIGIVQKGKKKTLLTLV